MIYLVAAAAIAAMVEAMLLFVLLLSPFEELGELLWLLALVPLAASKLLRPNAEFMGDPEPVRLEASMVDGRTEN